MSHNSIFQTSYTWSKNIADTEPIIQIIRMDLRTPPIHGKPRLPPLTAARILGPVWFTIYPLDGHNGFMKKRCGGWEPARWLALQLGNAVTITETGEHHLRLSRR